MPRPDLATAVIQEVRLQGGMMSGAGMMGMCGGVASALNGRSMTSDGNGRMPPLFEIAHGRSCILGFRNETA